MAQDGQPTSAEGLPSDSHPAMAATSRFDVAASPWTMQSIIRLPSADQQEHSVTSLLCTLIEVKDLGPSSNPIRSPRVFRSIAPTYADSRREAAGGGTIKRWCGTPVAGAPFEPKRRADAPTLLPASPLHSALTSLPIASGRPHGTLALKSPSLSTSFRRLNSSGRTLSSDSMQPPVPPTPFVPPRLGEAVTS